MIKAYYQLAKPGIIYGNIITAAAGFFLASKGNVDWFLLVAMLVGLSLVIGGACVFNNYLDRDIDEKMERTRSRATVTGEISRNSALIYGCSLLILGLVIINSFINLLTLYVALIGVFAYVVLYTPLKRRTIYSTLIGAIAGATPPVVGYCAVTNRFNLEALLLFLILFFWQMPHFYAIGMYRHDDYTAASIPLLSVKKGNRVSKVHILFYIIAFIIATASLTVFGFTKYVYLVVVLLLGFVWFFLGIFSLQTKMDDALWARKMFLFSLIVIVILSVILSFGAVLP